MLSLSISLTSTNTVRTLPLSQPPLPFLDRATQPPKDAPTSGWSRISTLPSPYPRLNRTIRLDHPHQCQPRISPQPSHRWSQIMMAKWYYLNLRGPIRSKLSHHRRSAQSTEEGTTVLTRMLGGPILPDLRRRSQCRNRCNPTLSAHSKLSKVKNKVKSKGNFSWSSLVT